MWIIWYKGIVIAENEPRPSEQRNSQNSSSARTTDEQYCYQAASELEYMYHPSFPFPTAKTKPHFSNICTNNIYDYYNHTGWLIET